MSKNIFNHNVQLIPLNIKNKERDAFRLELLEIPYLLYEVEVLSTGEKIVINKPGGKRSWEDYHEMILWFLYIHLTMKGFG